MYYLGCPMWANPRWQGTLYQANSASATFLNQYSRFFNAVEGNTTFYADPSPETITRWLHQSTADFRFNLKVPRAISHQSASQHSRSAEQLVQWLDLIQPLASKIGFVHLQLPASVDPALLTGYQPLLELIRARHRCALEIRHPAFFDKSVHEPALHQLLRATGCERVVLDSRALFATPATTAALQDAQQKKPRLPVHVCALTEQPVFRFIGSDDLSLNRQFYQPWLSKMQQWLQEGKTPFGFFHTPDNAQAPLLARQFAEDLQQRCGVSHPVLQPWPVAPAKPQLALFAEPNEC